MRMCQEHWSQLKQLVEASGLGKLVSKSGEEASMRLTKELTCGVDASTFDPLMAAHNILLSHIMDVRGLALMLPNDDGSDRCPLCYMIESCGCGEAGCKTKSEQWLEYAVRDAVEVAKELGLLASA